MAQYSSINRNYGRENHTNPGMRTAYHQKKYEESLKNQEFLYSSAAPAIDIPEEVPTIKEKTNTERRERRTPDDRNRRRQAHHTKTEPAVKFNFAGFVLVIAAFAFLGAVMVHYVKLRNDLSHEVKAVASAEVTLTELKASNDEFYSRTVSSVDLDEIADKAKNELNMSYASEGQIITYTAAGNDYMRKVDNK